MSDLRKGYIRWWNHRVMDYDGDNCQHWEPEFIRDYNDSFEVVQTKWAEYVKIRKVVYEPYEDKPYATVFHAVMKLQGFYRGRSAAGFTFVDESGREHTMRIKCVVDLLKNAVLNKGVVEADWCYCKQGSNFSLKLIVEK